MRNSLSCMLRHSWRSHQLLKLLIITQRPSYHAKYCACTCVTAASKAHLPGHSHQSIPYAYNSPCTQPSIHPPNPDDACILLQQNRAAHPDPFQGCNNLQMRAFMHSCIYAAVRCCSPGVHDPLLALQTSGLLPKPSSAFQPVALRRAPMSAGPRTASTLAFVSAHCPGRSVPSGVAMTPCSVRTSSGCRAALPVVAKMTTSLSTLNDTNEPASA